MTRPNTPIYIPLAMILGTFVFGGIMIMREPSLAWVFAGAMAFLPIAWAFIELRKFRGELDDHAMEDRSTVRASIAGAGLLLVVPLALTVLFTSGFSWITDAIEQRTMGIVFGLVMALYGNRYAKRPASLSDGEASATGQQAFIRFSAQVFVITGLIYTAIWIFAPLDPALPISMTVLVLGSGSVMVRGAIQALRKR
jgi:hypothetical protein